MIIDETNKKDILIIRVLILLMALACLAPTKMAAQDVTGLKFRRLDTRDGLSNSCVRSILEDSHGFVWIGTLYGLNRYDGSRFRTFNSDVKDSTALRYDNIDGIYETYEGNLLLQQGTTYCFFDRKTEKFDYNMAAWLESLGLKGNVEKLYIDRKKNYWIKMYSDDIFYYNPQTGKINKLRFGNGRYGFPPQCRVSTFASHGDQTFMVTNSGDLMCMDGERGEVKWVNSYIRNHGGDPKFEYVLNMAPNGDIWVLGLDKQWIYSQKAKRWFADVRSFLSAMGIGNNLPEKALVWDVDFDKQGRAWICTDHLGMLIADFTNKSLTTYTNDKSDQTSISDETLLTMTFSRDGNAWIGSYKNGINQCVLTKANIKNLLIGNVNTITEDKEGNYWLGTNDNGVIKYNPRTQEKIYYNKSNSGLRSNVMVSSLTAADGSIWFGTYGGGVSHIANGKVTTICQDNNPEINNNIWGLAQDKQGNIWMGTLGSGVQRIDAKTGEVKTFNFSTSKISSDYVSSMQMAANGWIVVGTSDHYSLINPESQTVVNMQVNQDSSNLKKVSPASIQVFTDSRGLVWYASAAGLNIFDNEKGTMTFIDKESGLPGSNTCSIAEDQQHDMWVVTEYGISYIKPRHNGDKWDFDIRNFGTRDGLLPGPYNQRSSRLTHNGLLLVGGVNGVDIINTENMSHKRKVGKPMFSGLKIFDNEIRAGKEYDGRIVLEQTIDECRYVKLTSHDDQFTIQLAAGEVIAGNEVQFLYKLEGFSDKWIKTDPSVPNITLTGLPAGNYTLIVKQIDENNEASGEESRLKISIEPPFYRSWWAYVIYLLIIVGIVYYLYRRLQKKWMHEQTQEDHDKQESEIRMELYASISEQLSEPLEKAIASVDAMTGDEQEETRQEHQRDAKESLEELRSRIDEILNKYSSI